MLIVKLLGPCTHDILCEVTTSDFDFSSGYSLRPGLGPGSGCNGCGI